MRIGENWGIGFASIRHDVRLLRLSDIDACLADVVQSISARFDRSIDRSFLTPESILEMPVRENWGTDFAWIHPGIHSLCFSDIDACSADVMQSIPARFDPSMAVFQP